VSRSTTPAPATVPAAELNDLVNGSHGNPHGVLGAHPTVTGTTVIRTLRPEADAVAVVIDNERTPLQRIHDGGVFAGELPGAPSDYRLEVTYSDHTYTVDDPYRWLPTLGEVDLHLIGEGRHEQLWEVLGAHERTLRHARRPVSGVSFAVWAPNAKGSASPATSTTGPGAPCPCASSALRGLGAVRPGGAQWPQVQVPGPRRGRQMAAEGRPDGLRHRECQPLTASVVFTSDHEWEDADGSSGGRHRVAQRPMSVYEVHSDPGARA
jgi:1,4-alpha-glucan branching enzyme